MSLIGCADVARFPSECLAGGEVRPAYSTRSIVAAAVARSGRVASSGE
jgi:hypothetical protein